MTTNVQKTGWQAWQVTAAVLSVIVLAGLVVFFSMDRKSLPPDELQPARLLGKPLRLQTPAGERILVLSEQYGVHWYWYAGSGRRSFGGMASEQVINIDLWAFEPGNATPLWRQRFKNNTPGVMVGVEDMLVAYGDRAWLELREPALLSASDGSVLAPTRPTGEPLRGSGVYDVRDLQTHGLRTGDRWVGVLSAAGQAKLTGPEANGHRPDSTGFAGDDVDYALWTARVRDQAEAWGNSESYSDFQQLGEPIPMHRAGFLMLAQRGEVLRAPDPDSALLLTRQPDAEGGRLGLARIALEDGRHLWSVQGLPIARLRHLLAGTGDLVLVGDAPRPAPPTPGDAAPEARQWLVFLDIASGQRSEFDLARASLAVEPPAVE